MRLKRLTVHGFKSFADKTHFDFDAVLTGIVGPNGCGKSNVVDALKWVLGDQRARSLRGTEMTDVIFKGAEGRDGCHQAEVLVELVDEEGRLGGRTEITVGRRLTKDKESDYLLNGERVRLKDVRDVLMDTGLGVGAYSVMEQGRIDAVLSANPEDRRAIFEEAAGISRFKLQKRETLRKLDRTEQNLARVKDLLEERARRLRSLKIQAGKARRFQELRAELRDVKTAVTVVEAAELRAKLSTLEEQLVARQGELAATETRSAALEAQRAELEASIEARGHELEQLQEAVRTQQSAREAAELDAQNQAVRAQDQRALADESEQQRDALLRQHADKIEALRAAQARAAQLDLDLAALAGEVEQQRAAVREAQRSMRELGQQREAVRRRVLEWMNDRVRARNTAQDKRAEVRALDGRRAGLQQRHDALESELLEVEREVAGLDGAVRWDGVQSASLALEERMILGELDAADTAAAELQRAESELRQQLSSVLGRLEILADMESHLEGLDQGPRFLLEQKPAGLQGRLVDLIDADLEYSAALEAALGSYVQALVVESRADADAMHRMLREQGQGRAILLVEREIPDDLLKARPLFDLPPAAEGLVEHVRFPPYAKCLMHWLLRGVCLVDSLEHAEPSRHDLCFVTKEGGLICGPRIEGGSKEGQGGLVVRKATMQVLEAEAATLREKLEELGAGKQLAAERVAALREEAQVVGGLLQELRAREVARGAKRGHLIERLVAGQRQQDTMALEVQQIDGDRRVVRGVWNDLLLRTLVFTRLEQRDVEREHAISAEVATAQAEVEAAVRAEQEVQLKQVACRSELEAAHTASRMHEQAQRELAASREALAQRVEQCQRAAEQHDAAAEKSRAAARAAEDAVAGVTEQRDAAAAALQQLRAELGSCNTERSGLQGERAALQESITETRLGTGELEHRFAWLETRLRDEVGVALRRCLGEIEGHGKVLVHEFGPKPSFDPAHGVAPRCLLGPPLPPAMLADELELERLWLQPEFDRAACAKEVQVLQAQIQRLGPVNQDAVAELESEESDFALTEQEVKDLTESRRSLIEALQRMERESRTLFEDTFQQARDNFQNIFRKLFQGGRADMFLGEAEDALEGGIEIMARPPGKELQSINLLSGGERTLTALAILFAVFKVKPSPFCILDEVDAALDDTNVERFLRVLDDFVGPTQFCVVTHHKRTMAACDQLYGVTMQRRGVSSRIAVSLDMVEDLSETGRRGSGEQNGASTKATKQRIAGEEALGF
ncbi:MAG: chromosome segregation protein SMC [Planctomycetes bacterium]|nr:chromosome segregation protein SMC [Planctomycetota bacterium]